MSDKIMSYGGQAVIEGVMMRGKNAFAIAMRNPEGNVVIHQETLAAIYRSQITQIPFLRGIILLWDALGLGMRALTISANTQTGEDEKLEGPALYLTLGFSLLFGIGLFFVLPAALVSLFEYLASLFTLPAIPGLSAAGPLTWSPFWGNVLEGMIRLSIMIGYIWAVGRIPDIARVFGYHGAEHKTINAYEAGAELKPEVVAQYPIEHPRCGTAFLLTLILISILVFTALGDLSLGWKLASRVLLIPVLAGIAVEYIRWTARNLHLPIVQTLIRPSLALQSLTTREPDHDMLEVAIASFAAMRAMEESSQPAA